MDVGIATIIAAVIAGVFGIVGTVVSAYLNTQNTKLKAKNSELRVENEKLQKELSSYENARVELLPYEVNLYTIVFDGNDSGSYFKVGNKKITKGVSFNLFDCMYPYAIWNTEGKYKTMTFTVCLKGKHNASIYAFLDGKEYDRSYYLLHDDSERTITVPLDNVKEVKLELFGFTREIFFCAIYDIYFQ